LSSEDQAGISLHKKYQTVFSLLPQHDDFDDDFRSVFGITTSKDNSIEVQNNLNTDKNKLLTEKKDEISPEDNVSQIVEKPSLSTEEVKKEPISEDVDDIPDIFGTKSTNTESIHSEIPNTKISSNPSSTNIPSHPNESEPSTSYNKIPKPSTTVPAITPFRGFRSEETIPNRSISPPISTEGLPDKIKSHQTPLPSESSRIVTKIKESKPKISISSSGESDNRFLSFLKGAILKENRIKDEDDYIPAKPPPPPPKEEEIDESELIGQPNPIWG